MQILRKYLQYRKMKSLIKQATEAIYSEKFDFDSILEKMLYQTDKLNSLIAIKFAVFINEPLNKDDIKQALEEVQLAKGDMKDDDVMQTFLRLLQESTELDWLNRTELILKGKLAFKQNKYSYEGAIYHLENAKKGPASIKERDKWKALANNLEEAENNYNTHLSKLEQMEEEDSRKKAQAVLDNMIKERDERRKNMTDDEIQKEIALAKIQGEEAIKSIKEIVKKNKKD